MRASSSISADATSDAGRDGETEILTPRSHLASAAPDPERAGHARRGAAPKAWGVSRATWPCDTEQRSGTYTHPLPPPRRAAWCDRCARPILYSLPPDFAHRGPRLHARRRPWPTQDLGCGAPNTAAPAAWVRCASELAPARGSGRQYRREPLIAEPLGEAILSLAGGQILEIHPGEGLILFSTGKHGARA